MQMVVSRRARASDRVAQPLHLPSTGDLVKDRATRVKPAQLSGQAGGLQHVHWERRHPIEAGLVWVKLLCNWP